MSKNVYKAAVVVIIVGYAISLALALVIAAQGLPALLVFVVTVYFVPGAFLVSRVDRRLERFASRLPDYHVLRVMVMWLYILYIDAFENDDDNGGGYA